ncbi:MAG: hypothetical protein KGJ13_04935 [Patescibacteria group bacterium]|nr:hypothetical protein [Patescibacteria group bacterium]
MDDSLKPQPKISLPEAIFISLILVVVTLVNLIPFVGDITSPVFGALMFIYLFMKGLSGTSVVATNLAGYVLGMIPGAQELPTELAAWIVTIIIDRNPKLETATEKIGAAENLAGGGAAGVAKETGGTAAAMEETEAAAKATQGAGTATEGIGAAENAGIDAETGTSEIGPKGGAKTPEEIRTENELTPEEERPIEEVNREKLFEEPVTEDETMGKSVDETEVGEKTEAGEPEKKSLEEQVKERLEKLPQSQPAPEEEEESREEGEETESGDNLAYAAIGEEQPLLGEQGRLSEEFFKNAPEIPRPPKKEESSSNNVIPGDRFSQTAKKMQDIKQNKQPGEGLRKAA